MTGEDTADVETSASLPTAHDIAKALIQTSESCRLVAYQDSVGVWTIGWGHTGVGVYPGMSCTQQQADDWLDGDMASAEHAVLSLAPLLEHYPHKQAALIDFVFNEGGHKFHDSTLLKLVNGLHWEAVPAELLKWVWAGGKVLNGLVARRKAEAALWQLPD